MVYMFVINKTDVQKMEDDYELKNGGRLIEEHRSERNFSVLMAESDRIAEFPNSTVRLGRIW